MKQWHEEFVCFTSRSVSKAHDSLPSSINQLGAIHDSHEPLELLHATTRGRLEKFEPSRAGLDKLPPPSLALPALGRFGGIARARDVREREELPCCKPAQPASQMPSYCERRLRDDDDSCWHGGLAQWKRATRAHTKRGGERERGGGAALLGFLPLYSVCIRQKATRRVGLNRVMFFLLAFTSLKAFVRLLFSLPSGRGVKGKPGSRANTETTTRP